MAIKKKELKRLKELRERLIDGNGDYKKNADHDELIELAKLEAKADGLGEDVKVKDEVSETEKDPFTVDFEDKKKPPKGVRVWTKQGYVYCGVDKNGMFILWNKDEKMFYRLSYKKNSTPDAFAEQLRKSYIDSLK